MDDSRETVFAVHLRNYSTRRGRAVPVEPLSAGHWFPRL